MGIVDEVRSMIPQQPGNRPWHERVSEDKRELLATIIEAWHGGAFGKQRRPAARAIAAVLQRHGISIGEQGVDVWLSRSSAK